MGKEKKKEGEKEKLVRFNSLHTMELERAFLAALDHMKTKNKSEAFRRLINFYNEKNGVK